MSRAPCRSHSQNGTSRVAMWVKLIGMKNFEDLLQGCNYGTSVKSVGDLHSHVSYVLLLCLSQAHFKSLDGVAQDYASRRERGLGKVALIVLCVIHDHTITTDPCCALCVLSTHSSVCIVVRCVLLGHHASRKSVHITFSTWLLTTASMV
jgi:hypothetical protein